MAEPWFDEALFGGLYGGLVGGIGGSLIGLAGGYGGDQARKGRKHLWVSIVLISVATIGVASMGLGVAALAFGQPAVIWEIPGGVGLLLSWVALATVRGLKRLHEQAINQPIVPAEKASDVGTVMSL
jgi:hypothetical protein